MHIDWPQLAMQLNLRWFLFGLLVFNQLLGRKRARCTTYHRILPKLFMGAYGGTASDIDRLKRETGATAVLNLQTDDDMRYFKLDWESLRA